MSPCLSSTVCVYQGLNLVWSFPLQKLEAPADTQPMLGTATSSPRQKKPTWTFFCTLCASSIVICAVWSDRDGIHTNTL